MAGDPYSGNARLVGLTDVLLRDLVRGFIFQHMRRWAACLWALPSILLCVEPVCAQLPRGLEGCSPASQAATQETPRPPRIIVDDVRFDPSIPLPPELRTQLTQVVKEATERAVPGWLDEVLEVGVRGTLEDEGYFFKGPLPNYKQDLRIQKFNTFSLLCMSNPALYTVSVRFPFDRLF